MDIGALTNRLLDSVFLATRSTLGYLSKHRVVAHNRYLMFGFVRVRHLALLYMISAVVVALGSIGASMYYLL
ncbi:hypothetical protein IPJ72_05775 [Candidatus Peregrinibacteria bacterium]|nr:MAG: hypothetical protein IPJ72_05775 [Candidatus Peregrinibacteria bacterium]